MSPCNFLDLATTASRSALCNGAKGTGFFVVLEHANARQLAVVDECQACFVELLCRLAMSTCKPNRYPALAATRRPHR